MNSVLKSLLTLQEVDRDIHKVEAELSRLPKELAAQVDGLDNSKLRLATKRAEANELRTTVKEIEDTTVGLRQRLKKLEHESSNGTADAALIASYQHEMRNIKRNVNQAEDDGLKRVGRGEELDVEIAAMEEQLVADEVTFEEFKANVATETSAAEKALADLVAVRGTKTSEGIPASDLEIYRGLLKTRDGEALAELGDGLCEGCFVNLPKNIVVRLARGTELVQCPSCDRILFTYL